MGMMGMGDGGPDVEDIRARRRSIHRRVQSIGMAMLVVALIGKKTDMDRDMITLNNSNISGKRFSCSTRQQIRHRPHSSNKAIHSARHSQVNITTNLINNNLNLRSISSSSLFCLLTSPNFSCSRSRTCLYKLSRRRPRQQQQQSQPNPNLAPKAVSCALSAPSKGARSCAGPAAVWRCATSAGRTWQRAR